ncbi:MAG: hypothetical protein MUC83_09475, partial [Pirellula sp.]|nr:hypothetical protein [Pirellula sp.]
MNDKNRHDRLMSRSEFPRSVVSETPNKWQKKRVFDQEIVRFSAIEHDSVATRGRACEKYFPDFCLCPLRRTARVYIFSPPRCGRLRKSAARRRVEKRFFKKN